MSCIKGNDMQGVVQWLQTSIDLLFPRSRINDLRFRTGGHGNPEGFTCRAHQSTFTFRLFELQNDEGLFNRHECDRLTANPMGMLPEPSTKTERREVPCLSFDKSPNSHQAIINKQQRITGVDPGDS